MSSVEEPTNGTNGNGNVEEKDDETHRAEAQEHGSDTGDESESSEDDNASMNSEHGVVQQPANGAASHANGNGKLSGTQDDHSNGGDSEEEEDEQEGEEDDEDEDEEDEEDEEYEPALKYDLLGGSTSMLLEKDSASTLAVSVKHLAVGTHSGIIHVLDYTGARVKSYRPHSASVIDMCFDETADFIASASIDGQVVIHSLSSSESYAFNMKRPMRTVTLEPNFAKRTSRAFVCGGMAGNLVQYEKGWLGHKETVLHTGEGPIWIARWRGPLIAWANDLGVKIYDTASQTRITYIDRPADSPRAELYKCTLHWQDDSTLLIAWADIIKVARIRTRPKPSPAQASEKVLPPLMAEITALFGVEGMISGIVPYPVDPLRLGAPTTQTTLTSFLTLIFTPPDESFKDEATEDRRLQARRLADRPELRIISRSGEELSSDILSIPGYQTCGCNDYFFAEVPVEVDAARCYVVLNPKTIVLVKPRDQKDHVAWLVDRHRFEEALEQLETMPNEGVDAAEIGKQYIEHLFNEGEFEKAASLCSKVLGQDAKKWEDWIFIFVQKNQLQVIIPYIPTESPQLSRLVYEMVLAHFLSSDRQSLLKTIKEWPNSIYDVDAVIVAVLSELERTSSSSGDSKILMECLAQLYLENRQPGKALQYVLRLRWPNVFDLIREHNLFTDVQDQALLLVEFDQELLNQKKEAGESVSGRSPAISLLVDHVYSIPVARVVQQLRARSYYLYLYLDALFEKDPHLASDFADNQVELYAEFAPKRLVDFLRASNYYSLEKAYGVCKERDFVPEMVFLLGRMGNNKQALHLIIERLGDVNRAIDFAKEQNDDDLWEDLLQYSETRPAFIRGLLENVGAEIDPIRLIRRIQNGLEIPGLKEALIKILQAFNLQISLLEGCQTILEGDSATLARKLQKDQTKGFYETAARKCPICMETLHQGAASVTMLFLCRHVVHLRCVSGGENVTHHQDSIVSRVQGAGQDISGKIAFTALIHNRIHYGCPVCHKRDEGDRT